MISVLVNACNKTNSDPVVDARSCAKKGYLVAANNTGRWGLAEGKPNFVRINITDTDDLSAVQNYVKNVSRQVEVVTREHVGVTDTYKVRIQAIADTIGKTPCGQISKDESDAFLLTFGSTGIVGQLNGVDAEWTVFNAVSNTGFFSYGEEEEYIKYTELLHTPGTGVHRIRVDYSLSSLTDKAAIEAVVIDAGCAVVSHDTGKGLMVIEVKGSTVFNSFAQHTREHFSDCVCKSQYYFADKAAGTVDIEKQPVKLTRISGDLFTSYTVDNTVTLGDISMTVSSISDDDTMYVAGDIDDVSTIVLARASDPSLESTVSVENQPAKVTYSTGDQFTDIEVGDGLCINSNQVAKVSSKSSPLILFIEAGAWSTVEGATYTNSITENACVTNASGTLEMTMAEFTTALTDKMS